MIPTIHTHSSTFEVNGKIERRKKKLLLIHLACFGMKNNSAVTVDKCEKSEKVNYSADKKTTVASHA